MLSWGFLFPVIRNSGWLHPSSLFSLRWRRRLITPLLPVQPKVEMAADNTPPPWLLWWSAWPGNSPLQIRPYMQIIPEDPHCKSLRIKNIRIVDPWNWAQFQAVGNVTLHPVHLSTIYEMGIKKKISFLLRTKYTFKKWISENQQIFKQGTVWAAYELLELFITMHLKNLLIQIKQCNMP